MISKSRRAADPVPVACGPRRKRALCCTDTDGAVRVWSAGMRFRDRDRGEDFVPPHSMYGGSVARRNTPASDANRPELVGLVRRGRRPSALITHPFFNMLNVFHGKPVPQEARAPLSLPSRSIKSRTASSTRRLARSSIRWMAFAAGQAGSSRRADPTVLPDVDAAAGEFLIGTPCFLAPITAAPSSGRFHHKPPLSRRASRSASQLDALGFHRAQDVGHDQVADLR